MKAKKEAKSGEEIDSYVYRWIATVFGSFVRICEKKEADVVDEYNHWQAIGQNLSQKSLQSRTPVSQSGCEARRKQNIKCQDWQQSQHAEEQNVSEELQSWYAC